MLSDYHRSVNRPFLTFLIFVGALVIAAGALAYWFSPQFALFLDAERRDEPAFIFDFSLQGAAVQSPATENRGTLMRVVLGEGGRFHCHGELVRLLDGQINGDEWQQIDIYSLASGSDYLRLATHVDYLQLGGGPVGRQVLTSAVDPTIDLNFHGNNVRVIWLLANRTESDAPPSNGIEPFLATAVAHGATPPIRATVRSFTGSRPWQQLIAFEFRDERQALTWFRSLKTQTEFALMKSRHAHTVGLLYRDVPI